MVLFARLLWYPRAFLLLLTLGCVSCGPSQPPPNDDDDDATFPADDDDSGSAYVACDPPLGLSPSTSVVNPLDLVVFVGSGGTGDYHYELTEAPSGASVHRDLGIYIAGPDLGEDGLGVTDEIVLRDLGCDDTAAASVDVRAGLEVLPLGALLPSAAPPGQPALEIAFEISGGSGDTSCSLTANPSGATLVSPCTYVTGAGEGIDIVTVTDMVTGQVVERWVTVAGGAEFRAGASKIVFPVGSEFALAIEGGTGDYEANVSAPASGPLFADGWFFASETGTVDFTVVDRFTGQTTELQVESVLPQSAELERVGFSGALGFAWGPGDVNADGYADVLLGWAHSSVSAFWGGAVYLWLGGADGLASSPDRVWAGDSWEEQMGSQLGTGDLNGDTWVDLAIGIKNRTNGGNSQAGMVEVYFGLEGGGFSDEPDALLGGARANDHLGEGVVVCDFDGDGVDDLAASGPAGDHGEGESLVADVGTIHVYFGSSAGLKSEAGELSSDPDQIRWGLVPEEDELAGTWSWVLAEGHDVGRRLAAGDMNADGYCDLVAASWSYEREDDDDNTSDGLALLYMGSADGLSEEPSRAWRGVSAELGSELALGDINADGYDDLLLGAPRDGTNEAVADQGKAPGAVYLFLGGEDVDTAPSLGGWTETAEADWSAFGDNWWDRLGSWVTFGDFDGDGALDLWATGMMDEADGGVSNAGAISIFSGVPGALPTTGPPDTKLGGDAAWDFFGRLVAPLGAGSLDGTPGALVMANWDDDHGLEVGAPSFVPGDDPSAIELLDFPGEASGHHFGQSTAFIGDFDGDGFGDLAVGSPRSSSEVERSNGPPLALKFDGATFIYSGSTEGVSSTPYLKLDGQGGADAWDLFGQAVSSAGDFTGDGYPDLAVLTYMDSPIGLDAANYTSPNTCSTWGSRRGSVQIFAGYDGQLAPAPDPFEPAFIWFGPTTGAYLQSVAGGDFDFDGDGVDDLIVGQDRLANGSGAVHVIYGRSKPASVPTITNLCEPGDSWSWEGVENGSGLGYSVAPLGDLDDDGCDEFAAGAPGSDLGFSNQGAVYIFFGGGPNCTGHPEQRMMVLSPSHSNNSAGYSLGSGVDVDSDGHPDLAVGSPGMRDFLDRPGGAWFITSTHLRGLASDPGLPVLASVVSDEDDITTEPFTLGTGIIGFHGQVHEAKLGESVALVPPYEPGALGGVIAGAALSNLAGVERSGGARLHLFDPLSFDGSIEAKPSLVFGGETAASDGLIGQSMSVGVIDGTVYAAVGGYRGDGIGLDTGSLYVVELGESSD